MSTNYQIITDENLLWDFINNVLPDPVGQHEQHYCCLFARKKYCQDQSAVKHVKSDKSQLKRFTSRKARLFWKIKQLECPMGAYVQDNNPDSFVPQEALACYISVNPRDLYKSALLTIPKMAQLIQFQNQNANPHQEVMSIIQQTASRKPWITFDIDTKAEGTLEAITTILGPPEGGYYRVLETRGGYHVLVKAVQVPKERQKTWYKDLRAISDPGCFADSMIPVPGTYQGGFTPHFVI